MSSVFQGESDSPGFMQPFECSGQRRGYVDLDGTAADYFTARTLSGLDFATFNSKPGSFAGLQVMEGTHGGLQLLEEFGYEVYFLSRPPSGCPAAYMEKAEWVNQHFPQYRDRLILSPDKGCIGRPCDLLIDDHPEWGNAQNFPGTLILHKNWESTMATLWELEVQSAPRKVPMYIR